MSLVMERTGRSFGTEAANYTVGRKPYPKELFDLIQHRITPGNDLEVLDLGCGNGRATRSLKECGYQVTGYDVDPEMIAEAKALSSGIPYVVGSVKELAAKAHQYGLITAFASFHWFSTQEEIQAICSSLKSKGYFVIVKGNNSDSEFTKSCQKIVADTIGKAIHPHDQQKRLEAIKRVFTIVHSADINTIETFTFEEALAKVKSHSFWNELDTQQKAAVWPKLEEYVESSLVDNVIKIQLTYNVIIAQKNE